MIGYGGYYLCRQTLGVAFAPMKEGLGISAIEFGWISSIGTFTYALGKVTVGSLADSKLGGKFVFLFGLFGSAAFCFLFGFGNGLSLLILTWAMNRFFQSMGWSGLVNVLTRWFPRKTYGTAMGIMSVSYQFGGALVTLYAGFILSLGGSWKTLFIVPALTLFILGVLISPFLTQSPEDVGYKLNSPHESPANLAPEEDLSYFHRFLFLLSNRGFLIMLGLSFVLTFLRECFSLWMPAYFTEQGESASIAAFKSTLFPFLGCIGTLLGGWVSDRFLSGRRSPMMAFLILILIFCLVALGNLETCTNWVQSVFGTGITQSMLAMVLVGATGFFLLGSYSFVGGVVALDFGGKKTAGTAAGLLDGTGYLGATLAGVGVANLLVHSGWKQTFLVMAGCAVVGIILCLFLWILGLENSNLQKE